MRMAAGPSSLVETREALLIQARSGGICAAIPTEAAGGGRLLATGDREVGVPTDRNAVARAMSEVGGESSTDGGTWRRGPRGSGGSGGEETSVSGIITYER